MKHHHHPQRGGSGPWGPWSDLGGHLSGRQGGHHGRRGGPPPWLAGLFGAPDAREGRRGPRVRRGDVRAAILDVLAGAEEIEPLNGYQVIQAITARSEGAWRPSPGSVYPTIQQLEDEGLVEGDDARGRRALRLTAEGRTYVAEHPDELAAVWAPFEAAREDSSGGVDLRPEIGQVMSAVWQIVTSGTEGQRRAAIDVLVDTRRRLYGILADGDPADTEDLDDDADGAADEPGADDARPAGS
ncbi:PadR family transcriptional regulator [Nocardioides marmotae]|uniref:PadR family transcriptional regulator n=1 Tax=Nocardioides marmotae TaxID=2663857 RepID=UPI0012B5F57A|nr:PadR family transcriptional regulator [Nocardioides marmotae]MBC9732452.1 PadR family transcriptional regulator [Nocardioides marmotae]MTB83571.1 PadR family transcriptional regulator [Nocardioides marmotae]